MKTVRINVALVPNERVSARARRLSKRMRGLFVLDGSHHPHLTLYMSDFPAAAVPALLVSIRKKASSLRPQSLRAVALRQTKSGFVEVQYQNNRSLIALQKRVIGACNPLRAGVPAHSEALHLFSREGVRNTKQFGYPAVGTAYTPHITLTRHKTSQPLPHVSAEEFSFESCVLGIFAVGPHGTAKKRIATLKLKIIGHKGK